MMVPNHHFHPSTLQMPRAFSEPHWPVGLRYQCDSWGGRDTLGRPTLKEKPRVQPQKNQSPNRVQWESSPKTTEQPPHCLFSWFGLEPTIHVRRPSWKSRASSVPPIGAERVMQVTGHYCKMPRGMFWGIFPQIVGALGPILTAHPRLASSDLNSHIHIYIHTYVIIRTYIHTYVHTYIHTYICTYIRTYIRTYVHTYIHTYVHTYIRTYIHTYVHTYIHTYIRTYVHTYIRTYIHTYLRTYIPTYLRTYVHTYIHTYIHTYVPTYVHTYVHTYIHTYLHTYVPTYVRTYVHTYIHAYIHTYISIRSYICDMSMTNNLISWIRLGMFRYWEHSDDAIFAVVSINTFNTKSPICNRCLLTQESLFHLRICRNPKVWQ